jgi:hypothetical protein
MARYILVAAVVGSPPGFQYQVFHRGTAIADTIGNVIAGDIVWSALTNAPSVAMLPLDAAASAIMGLPITTLAAIAANGSIGGAGAGQQ